MKRKPTDIPKYKDLTPVEHDAVATQCGPQWLPRFLWRYIKQYTFRNACRRHDFNYWIGGGPIDRKIADLEFKMGMLKSGPNRRAALRYYGLVRRWGWLSFHYGPKRTYLDLGKAVEKYLSQ